MVGAVEYGYPFNFYSFFIEPWKSGHQYLFNLAGWFVLTLFLIQLLYIVTRKLFVKITLNEYLLMVFYMLVGILGTYLATIPAINNEYYYIIRILVGLPFFHLGFLYKEKLEKIDKFNSITFIALIIFQALLIYHYKDISYVLVFANFGGSILKPFLASFSGIWLYLHIAEMIEKSVKRDRLLQYIGKNSWDIMIHHLFVFWLINFGYYVLYHFNILQQLGFPNFDVNGFKTDIYYKYNWPETYLIYIIPAILLPLGLKFVMDHLRKRRVFRSVQKSTIN